MTPRKRWLSEQCSITPVSPALYGPKQEGSSQELGRDEAHAVQPSSWPHVALSLVQRPVAAQRAPRAAQMGRGQCAETADRVSWPDGTKIIGIDPGFGAKGATMELTPFVVHLAQTL